VIDLAQERDERLTSKGIHLSTNIPQATTLDVRDIRNEISQIAWKVLSLHVHV
jgi:hypothetical protein